MSVWNAHARAKRRKELAEWAAGRKFRFDPERDYGLAIKFPRFDCLQKGSEQYAYNVWKGDWQGRDCLGFDYHYETRYRTARCRRRTVHHSFSAVVLESHVPLKPLFLRPEGFLDRVAELVGFNDIDFESKEFSSSFYVKAPDRRWAYDVIHQSTMKFLLASPRYSIQLDRSHIIVYRSSTFSIPEFVDAAYVGAGVLERLPDTSPGRPNAMV